MSPSKMFAFNFNWKTFGVLFSLDFDEYIPWFLSVGIGPFCISIQKPKYWKNGII